MYATVRHTQTNKSPLISRTGDVSPQMSRSPPEMSRLSPQDTSRSHIQLPRSPRDERTVSEVVRYVRMDFDRMMEEMEDLVV